MTEIIKFTKAYGEAHDPVPADASALGSIPTDAFRYCEAMRQASAYGWYIFPPKDLHLTFDGREALYYEEGQWYPIKREGLEETFQSAWGEAAPEDLRDGAPPYLSTAHYPGLLQIWSGLFASTSPGWSLNVRAPANLGLPSAYSCYEGIVESDDFKPAPLFINVKLLATGREIFIPKDLPLFQVQPLRRECYGLRPDSAVIETLDEVKGDPAFWQGLRNTLQRVDKLDRRPGAYAAVCRRRPAASPESAATE